MIPPCAAIECALLGESWKQKAFTLYPISPSDAAADDPAKPVPTTMISIFGLLLGATNFKWFLWLVHLSEICPSGILESNFIVVAYLVK